MQLLKPLFTLAVASSIVTAAPAPTKPNPPRDLSDDEFHAIWGYPLTRPDNNDNDNNNNDSPAWKLTGYSNPNCEGLEVWTESGDEDTCKNTQALAASYRWEVRQPTEVHSWPDRDICDTIHIDGKSWGVVPVLVGGGENGGHESMTGCVTETGINGFEVKVNPKEPEENE